MPMDIRSFFKPKPGDARRDAAAVAAPNKGASKPPAVARTQKVGTGPENEKPSKKKPTRKIVINDDNSSADDEDPVRMAPVAAPPTESFNVTVAPKRAEDPKKRKPEKERVEISVAAFFGNTHESPPKKAKSQPPPPPDDVDDDDDDDELQVVQVVASPKKQPLPPKPSVSKPPLKSPPGNTSSPPRAAPTKASPPPRASKKLSSSTKTTSRQSNALTPSKMLSSINVDELVPQCLDGYTFVFTGVLDHQSREEAADMVKSLGGKVTTSVSGKTDYLVTGTLLEDGRHYTEGYKYRMALERGTMIVQGEEALYGLLQQYDEKARKSLKQPPPISAPSLQAPPTTTAASAAAAAPTAAGTSNPYARGAVKSNPYARTGGKNNPYAKKAAPAPPKSDPTLPATKMAVKTDESNQLWVDKYKPKTTNEILSNQENAKKLALWLARWEQRFNNPQAVGKAFSNPQGPWKAALLSGPPGIGKTTTATLVAKESGRDVIEFNASDVRSKKALKDNLGDITGSQTLDLSGNQKARARTKRCIIMDEVDGMGAGDRSGMGELIQMIKTSRVPIICICNDRQSQKMKSLLPYCMDLRFRRPVKSTIARRAMEIAAKEGLKVEENAVEAIADSCGNDVRQVINAIQMWASKNDGNTMTYKGVKEREHSTNKDEILRVGLFDAARAILEGRRGLANADGKTERDHFFHRNDAYFVDYNFVGLLVQQNYLKVVQANFSSALQGKFPQPGKPPNARDDVQRVLEDMHSAAQSMSDYALAEKSLRGDMNWSLLPFTGVLTVRAGYYAGGPNGGVLPGYPEFTTWLGRNSTLGKKRRLLQELQHHMNYQISGGSRELRESYLPVFRERFLSLLLSDKASEAIGLMDEYGLDRDDVFEKLDEFNMDANAATFAKLDSKQKAAFTRAYNGMAHKSQALVAEQGGTKKTKRKASSMSETADPDAIDDDVEEQEEQDEESDELDEEKLKALFKKSRRDKKPAAAKAAAKPKAAGRKKK